jgi:hypothetical protein
MRFLPVLLAAVLVTTTVTTQIASACGGDFGLPPQVLAVSQHIVHPTRARERSGDRAFVVLGAPIKDDGKSAWSFVAPRTFDTMQFLPLPPRLVPMEVTLVGSNGARVVKTDKQVALRNGWQDKQPRLALEVSVHDGESIGFAIIGNASDAKWSQLAAGKASVLTSWWLGRQGVSDIESVALSSVAGSGFEVVQYSSNDKTQFMVREKDRSMGVPMRGRVLGAVTTGGRAYLLVENGAMYLHPLPQLAKRLAS